MSEPPCAIRRTRRIRAWTALLVIATLVVLAGCGGSESPAQTGGHKTGGHNNGSSPPTPAQQDADGSEGGGAGGGSSGGTGQGREVVLDEFSFQPQPLELPAGGEVVLTLRNDGAAAHEFMLGREAKPGGGYETDLLAMVRAEVVAGEGYEVRGIGDGAGGHQDGDAGGHGDGHGGHGAQVTLDPGGSVTLRMNIPAGAKGEWEMGCFIPGHYEAGMKGTVVVR